MIKFKTKYINQLMSKGKKNKSELILFTNLKKMQKSYNKDSTEILKLSVLNLAPFFNIKKRKRKRKNSLEFPFFLNQKKRIMYALKELTKNNTKPKFYSEMINSAKLTGHSIINKEKLHKESFLKKKTSNYRWFY